MREGHGVCHILTQHLGDTTKVLLILCVCHISSIFYNIWETGRPNGGIRAYVFIFSPTLNCFQTFEELLRANDVDYYMGQCFREQLAQSSALAQRVLTKISGPPFSAPISSLSVSSGPDVWGYEVISDPRPRALSVAGVCPELDMLYNQMHEQNRGEGSQRAFQFPRTRPCLVFHPALITSMTSQATTSYPLIVAQGGVNLIEEHLQEVRCLRQRLEESIRTNEQLRQQLEQKLASTGRDGDTNEEVVQLQEAVFAARTRLKQAELEAEQWKEELRRLQAHTQEQGQQIHALRQERQANQDKTNRLVSLPALFLSLLLWYLVEVAGFPVELGELLGEVRSLRAQLQSSVQENSALKQLELHKQLEQKLGVGSPRAPSLSALTASPQRETFYRRQLLHDPLDPHSELEGEAPDGSFANRNGRHAIGHVDDFSALQQQVLEGRSLIQRMETTLQACLGPPLLEGKQKEGSELVCFRY
ncbi:hypothetical protein GOODEAATRI_006162 [Goodea atripinnis]|uniref:Uncharacterized protein n=1 Tax=Goodea atripinnis TaxID=208336 RepID=A0ABV0NTT8_9TELE